MFYKLLIFLCIINMSMAYSLLNPFVKIIRINYPNYHASVPNNYVNYPFQPPYNPPYQQPPYQQQTLSVVPIYSHLNTLPTINILAKNADDIGNNFTVVPMLVVQSENLNFISNGEIISASRRKPFVTLQTDSDDVIQCTPAANITLDTPLTIYSLKTSIAFPSQINITHENVRVSFRVGAVIVPIKQDTSVSDSSPVSTTVLYAIPTKPTQIDDDYVNNDKDISIDFNNQAVIVENMPESTTEGDLDDENSDLVNRNPPLGYPQSGQLNLQVFHNPKESPVLTAIREEAKKRI